MEQVKRTSVFHKIIKDILWENSEGKHRKNKSKIISKVLGESKCKKKNKFVKSQERKKTRKYGR